MRLTVMIYSSGGRHEVIVEEPGQLSGSASETCISGGSGSSIFLPADLHRDRYIKLVDRLFRSIRGSV
jgi:hypothetical protein